jgi:rhodanese-related sulfurtransferase
MHKLFRAALLVLALLLAQTSGFAQAVDIDVFEEGIQQPNIQIFDVRTAAEFQTGHLHDALQADFTKKEEFNERIKYLNKEKPVYVYCLSGGRSAAAATWMRENGFKGVVEMKGGINAWKKAGKVLDGATAGPQMTMNAFDQAIKAGKLVLVDVGAEWCPPCRKMEPVLQQFLESHKEVQLVKVDGGNDMDVMKAINATTLPTFIFYKNGKEIWRKTGIVDFAELKF